MDQQNAAVLQERAKPGRIKLPKRLPNLPNLNRAVLRGLHEAAQSYGCKSKSGSDCGDVTWYLHGEPFVAWQVHEEGLNQQKARNLGESRAALRLIIMLRKSGYFRIKARWTRLYWEQHRVTLAG